MRTKMRVAVAGFLVGVISMMSGPVMATEVIKITPTQSPWLNLDRLFTVDNLAVLGVYLPDPQPVLPARQPVRAPVRAANPIPPAEIEALLARFFDPADMGWALRVSYCESRWDTNAKNPSSTASGLFQAMRGWWSGDWGYPAFDPFDPVENVRFAAWLLATGGASHWVCR